MGLKIYQLIITLFFPTFYTFWTGIRKSKNEDAYDIKPLNGVELKIYLLDSKVNKAYLGSDYSFELES